MSLKSFNLNDPGFSDTLSKSMCLWLDDGFYTSSGFVSVSENLHKVNHPEYTTDGTVWGSRKKNWVWEDGSVEISVDGSLHTSNTVNYKEGLVIFDTAVTNVSGNYSYKHINIFNVHENKYYRGSNLANNYSGVYRQESIQLPCIAIEMGSSSSSPSHLGSFNRNVRQDVLLNIYHRNSDVVERIADILYNQVDTSIQLFDFDQSYRSGLYPLELNGELVNVSGRYNTLVETYPYSKARNNISYIQNSEKENITRISNELFHCTIRFETITELTMGRG